MEEAISLSAKEEIMYEMVKSVLNDGTSIKRVAARYGVSEKTVRRKIAIYLEEGKSGLAHKSRGRCAVNKTPADIQRKIIELYEEKYFHYNFTHFHQKLREVENIEISYSTLYLLLKSVGHTSCRTQRKRRAKKIHPIRNRRKAFGELVQLDASEHIWFGNEVTHLHLAIDDATSHILGAHFEKQETLRGYFELFKKMVSNYGVPEELFTDRRAIFCTKSTKSSRLEDDHNTQFRLAAHKLGVIEIHTSSVPQAKGRVGRAFQTLQDRLISEMISAKITSIDEANAFLPNFLADHNKRYALPIDTPDKAFVAGLSKDELNIALSTVCERTVSNGSYIKYKQKRYVAYDKRRRILIKAGTKVLVLRSLDNKLYLVHGQDIWPLFCQELLMLPKPEELQDTIYLPPKEHPWKEASYNSMLSKLRKAS